MVHILGGRTAESSLILSCGRSAPTGNHSQQQRKRNGRPLQIETLTMRYENSSASVGTLQISSKTQNDKFLEYGCYEFDYISVICGDRLPK
jgi:hypothetical protein